MFFVPLLVFAAKAFCAQVSDDFVVEKPIMQIDYKSKLDEPVTVLFYDTDHLPHLISVDPENRNAVVKLSVWEYPIPLGVCAEIEEYLQENDVFASGERFPSFFFHRHLIGVFGSGEPADMIKNLPKTKKVGNVLIWTKDQKDIFFNNKKAIPLHPDIAQFVFDVEEKYLHRVYPRYGKLLLKLKRRFYSTCIQRKPSSDQTMVNILNHVEAADRLANAICQDKVLAIPNDRKPAIKAILIDAVCPAFMVFAENRVFTGFTDPYAYASALARHVNHKDNLIDHDVNDRWIWNTKRTLPLDLKIAKAILKHAGIHFTTLTCLNKTFHEASLQLLNEFDFVAQNQSNLPAKQKQFELFAELSKLSDENLVEACKALGNVQSYLDNCQDLGAVYGLLTHFKDDLGECLAVKTCIEKAIKKSPYHGSFRFMPIKGSKVRYDKGIDDDMTTTGEESDDSDIHAEEDLEVDESDADF